MHSQINVAPEQSLFQFLGEQALVTDFSQCHIQNYIPGGFHPHYPEGVMGMDFLQALQYPFGLP
jgi:hypothetical protein